MSLRTIQKVLSANDTGETGGHQAGILVPKEAGILDFFPRLNATVKNPRAVLGMRDDAGREWTFCFIYYNNRFFGGTRNEYRLTGMTAFFREFNLKAGDSVILRQESPRQMTISYCRAIATTKILRLSTAWKVIESDV